MAFTTGNTAVDDVFATWINKKFISDLEYNLQHAKFTTDAEVPKGDGANIARFVEFAPPGANNTGVPYSGSTTYGSLTEASTTGNEITSITTNPTNITIAEYGEFIKIGQLYEYAAVGGTRAKLSKRLLDGAVFNIDGFVRSKAIQSTNILYATQAQDGGVTTGPASLSALGAAAIIKARKLLSQGLATGFTGVSGVPDNMFAAVLTEQQQLDVVTEVTTLRVFWNNCVVNVPGAMGQEKFVKGYMGQIYGTATFVTNLFTTVSYTAAAQVGFVYGDGGVAAASFGTMKPQVILNDVNSPYKNVNSVAWHAMFGAELIASARVVKIYSTGS